MNSKSIDERIRQALSKEDAEVFDELNAEQSLFAQGMQLLNGRNRWINLLFMVVSLIFVGVGAFCMWQFSAAEEMKELLGWSLGIVATVIMVSMMKIWAWMDI